MKKFLIQDCGVYPFDVVVAIGVTSKETLNYVQKRLPYDLTEEEKKHFQDFDGMGKTLQLIKGQNILWLRDFKNDSSSIAILSHELFHVVYQTMWRVGIKLSDPSEEAFTYLIEYLTKNILKKLIKK